MFKVPVPAKFPLSFPLQAGLKRLFKKKMKKSMRIRNWERLKFMISRAIQYASLKHLKTCKTNNCPSF